MSILLLFASSLLVLILLFNKQVIFRLFNSNRFFIRKFSNTRWFQNPWWSGLFLFFLNTFLFSITVLLIFLSGKLEIPYLHIVIMFFATFMSIYLWVNLHNANSGGKREKLIMGSVGSSFYLIFLLIVVYIIATLEPSTPEEDTFMAFIGLVFAFIVSFVAWITCFSITGLSSKKTKVIKQ